MIIKIMKMIDNNNNNENNNNNKTNYQLSANNSCSTFAGALSPAFALGTRLRKYIYIYF